MSLECKPSNKHKGRHSLDAIGCYWTIVVCGCVQGTYHMGHPADQVYQDDLDRTDQMTYTLHGQQYINDNDQPEQVHNAFHFNISVSAKVVDLNNYMIFLKILASAINTIGLWL